MKKREIISALINIANDLDNQHMYDDADDMTKIATDMTNRWMGDPDYNPNDQNSDMYSGAEDKWLGEQELQKNINLDNDMRERRRYVADPNYQSDFADQIPNQVPPRHKAEEFKKQLERAKSPHKPLDITIDPSLIGKDDPWM